jgi:hypothetical protein
LQKLVGQPLFLAIATLAYKDHAAAELVNLSEAARMQILFDRYIQQMFVQRPLPPREQLQMRRWLRQVAQQMGSEKEFLIERMQPRDWLRRSGHQWQQYRLIVGLIVGLIAGLLWGLIAGLLWGLLVYLSKELSEGLDSIDLVEALQMSMSSGARREILKQLKQNVVEGLIRGLRLGLIVGLIEGLTGGPIALLLLSLLLGLIGVTMGGLSELLIVALIRVLLWGLVGVLLWGLIGVLLWVLVGGLKADIQTRTQPNQGIWNSRNNTLLLSLVVLGLTPLLYLALAHVPWRVDQARADCIIRAIIYTPFLFAFLHGGGQACIQHFALRLVLYGNLLIPWNFVRFFQQAEDRLFIQRTGGSYIFIHRTLQEHFAAAPLPASKNS